MDTTIEKPTPPTTDDWQQLPDWNLTRSEVCRLVHCSSKALSGRLRRGSVPDADIRHGKRSAMWNASTFRRIGYTVPLNRADFEALYPEEFPVEA